MIALYTVFAAASLVFLVRLILGPFHFLVSVSSPLNAEGIVAVSFLAVLILRARERRTGPATPVPPFVLFVCGLGAAAAFLPNLTTPLIHDAWAHIGYAAANTFTGMLRHAFVQFPPETGAFFRPLGFLSFWLDYHWAGINPTAWFLWNLTVHLGNCALIWLLARRLSLPPIPATVAALIFAVHGGRPEVVAWAGARFDLLATLFTLAALVVTLQRGSVWIVASLAALALLSKEAAFALPLLILLFIPFRPDLDRRYFLRAAAAVAAVCVAVLIWRTWYLGGVGGYAGASGEPTVFQLSAVRSAKALFFRQWAILFFPINWSQPSGIALEAASVLLIIVLAAFLVLSRASRRNLLLSLAFVIVAVLPAQHLLLIGADLNGARVLYLPVIGVALFWGFAVEGLEARAMQIALSAALLLFNVAALEHNLAVWRDVAAESERICTDFGRQLARDPRPVVIPPLPATRDGIFYLKNGFAACVALSSGQSAGRIYEESVAPAGARRFMWSEKSQSLVEVAQHPVSDPAQ